MRVLVLLGAAAIAVVVPATASFASADPHGTSVCKDGGFASHMQSAGAGFANQGDCVSFLNHGGAFYVPPPPPVDCSKDTSNPACAPG